MSAGWGTGNTFGILGEDDETGEGAIRVPAPAKAAVPVAAKSNKEEPKAVSKNSAVVDNKESNRKQDGARERRPPRARDERSHEEGGQQHRQQQQQQAPQQQTSNNNNNNGGAGGIAGAEPQPERGFNRTRGTSERTGGERRERRPNPDNVGNPSGQRAPRTYDRQSGTGRGREQKRHGAGRGNWGSNEEEIALEQQQQAPSSIAGDNWGATTSEANVSWGTPEGAPAEGGASNEQTPSSEPAAAAEPPPPRELTEEEKARQAEREAEAKLMTLDEYLKGKKSLSYKLPEARKAGEGEDDSQWANFVAAKSDKSASDEATGKKGEEKKEKAAKKVPLPAELLRFKGEQQRRDSERRERGPRDSERSFQRRDGDAPRPRPPRPQQQQQQHGAGKTQVDFAATDFPALKQ